jgi:hypothetical protein
MSVQLKNEVFKIRRSIFTTGLDSKRLKDVILESFLDDVHVNLYIHNYTIYKHNVTTTLTLINYSCVIYLLIVMIIHYVIYFVSLIGGGNLRTQRKPLTCRKSLINFIT